MPSNDLYDGGKRNDCIKASRKTPESHRYLPGNDRLTQTGAMHLFRVSKKSNKRRTYNEKSKMQDRYFVQQLQSELAVFEVWKKSLYSTARLEDSQAKQHDRLSIVSPLFRKTGESHESPSPKQCRRVYYHSVRSIADSAVRSADFTLLISIFNHTLVTSS